MEKEYKIYKITYWVEDIPLGYKNQDEPSSFRECVEIVAVPSFEDAQKKFKEEFGWEIKDIQLLGVKE